MEVDADVAGAVSVAEGKVRGAVDRVEEQQPLSLGTAVHMATTAVRANLLHDRGFLYEDVHYGGTRTTYLSEGFTLKNFVAVLQINVGALEDFPNTGLVRCNTAPSICCIYPQ